VWVVFCGLLWFVVCCCFGDGVSGFDVVWFLVVLILLWGWRVVVGCVGACRVLC
jgi:hypothetical protein